ncbi:hypothetical protein U27_06160 [Candidatus Vecturithrix granuli]|uniref:Uncharacterized protein n=1 Tax=Vecturithrix granuli TaxID=1499967 RepID=A0A081C3M8_VECG1|nr:hypothetical protein U27_06160 [Candidatus Vecturithrix granuli]
MRIRVVFFAKKMQGSTPQVKHEQKTIPQYLYVIPGKR